MSQCRDRRIDIIRLDQPDAGCIAYTAQDRLHAGVIHPVVVRIDQVAVAIVQLEELFFHAQWVQ